MKIGILISGRGSNMVAIVDAVKSGEVPDSLVAVVISDRPKAAGLEKARERGVETVVVERRGRTREEHDADIIAELQNRGVELVCLAGYMRLLSKSFVRAFVNKIVNIHPSLLPAFPGLDAQKQAIELGVKYSGCTVHYVDEGLDSGAIILQQWVPVMEDDTVESLSARILEREHELYVEALRHIAIEANSAIGQSPDKSPKYKVLKSIAHNLSHSFVTNTFDEEGLVMDEIKRVVRDVDGHRISIYWIGGENNTGVLTPRILECIKAYNQSVLRFVHDSGALMASINEFRTDIYLNKKHQIAVEGVLTDDRGRTYIAPVYDF